MTKELLISRRKRGGGVKPVGRIYLAKGRKIK